jgi:hypothetical protein
LLKTTNSLNLFGLRCNSKDVFGRDLSCRQIRNANFRLLNRSGYIPAPAFRPPGLPNANSRSGFWRINPMDGSAIRLGLPMPSIPSVKLTLRVPLSR